MQKITIGRDPLCDIRIDESVEKVSREHASIYKNDRGQLVFEDHSTNGSSVNGERVNNGRVIIRQGDKIILGNSYKLSWQDIINYFPSSISETVRIPYPGRTVRGDENRPIPNERNDDSDFSITPDELNKWNWGAFALWPFWGFANGMWWLFLLSFAIVILSYAWIVSSVDSYYGELIGVIAFINVVSWGLNIFMGINGNRWAWKNKKWRDRNHFLTVQYQWKSWGIVFFVLSILQSISAWIRLLSWY